MAQPKFQRMLPQAMNPDLYVADSSRTPPPQYSMTSPFYNGASQQPAYEMIDPTYGHRYEYQDALAPLSADAYAELPPGPEPSTPQPLPTSPPPGFYSSATSPGVSPIKQPVLGGEIYDSFGEHIAAEESSLNANGFYNSASSDLSRERTPPTQGRVNEDCDTFDDNNGNLPGSTSIDDDYDSFGNNRAQSVEQSQPKFYSSAVHRSSTASTGF